MEKVKTIHDYLEIVRRRKKSIILPILILFAISVIVAVAIPPVYRSTSTILIEEQDIPEIMSFRPSTPMPSSVCKPSTSRS